MSHLGVARTVSGRTKVDNIFARDTLVSIVDKALPDKAFRILALIRACSFDKPCALAFEEIGEALNCSGRQVIRHIATLEQNKYINVSRSGNRRNLYSAPEAKTAGRPVATSAQCGSCRKYVKAIGPSGICRSCVSTADLEQRVSDARAELGDEATAEQLAAHLKNAKLARRIRRILAA